MKKGTFNCIEPYQIAYTLSALDSMVTFIESDCIASTHGCHKRLVRAFSAI